MPDILGRRQQLRQDIGAPARKAPELPVAGARRGEEQIVIEEACIDRAVPQHEVARIGCLAVHEHHRNALAVEGAGPRIGVVHDHLRHARDIALDGEHVGLRAWTAQERIDAKQAAALIVEVLPARRVGDGEAVADPAVDHRDQAAVLERLQPLEAACLARASIGRRQNRAAGLVDEEIVASPEQTRLLGLEHAARLVDEAVVLRGQIHEARDQAGVEDVGGAPTLHVDGQMRLRPNLARVRDRRLIRVNAIGINADIPRTALRINGPRIVDGDRALLARRDG